MGLSFLSPWTWADVINTIRRVLLPYNVSIYLPRGTPQTGIVVTGSIANKLNVPEIPSGTPRGFDIFETLEGPALRFIGSGLGNGDTARLDPDMQISIESTTGSGETIVQVMTRPYTETSFANAIEVPGCFIGRDLANNDQGAVSIVSPFVDIADGDLLELAIIPQNTMTVTITAAAVAFKEVK